MSIALATQLREGTKKSHTMAENTGFVSCFLKGVVDKSTYRKLIADLYFVYSAMEAEIGRLCEEDHPIISRLNYPELNRCKTLEQDLVFYFGSDLKIATIYFKIATFTIVSLIHNFSRTQLFSD